MSTETLQAITTAAGDLLEDVPTTWALYRDAIAEGVI